MSAAQVGPDRNYLGHLVVEEALRLLPAALQYPTQQDFRQYVEENLSHNSRTTRRRYAGYLANRYSENGLMNLSLARSLTVFTDERLRREILFFETIQSMLFLRDITANWLAFQPEAGATRKDLETFIISRLPDIKPEDIIKRTVVSLKKFYRLRSKGLGCYIPIWVEPPLEAFVYVLCRLFPESTVVPVESFKVSEDVRALLWQPPTIEPLLRKAEQAGYVSRITQLDTYYQFALSGSGNERLERLFNQAVSAPAASDNNNGSDSTGTTLESSSQQPAQIGLPFLET